MTDEMLSGQKHALRLYLNLSEPAPHNGQTYSINSSTVLDELFLSVFDHFVGLALKGLKGLYCNFTSNFVFCFA